MQALVDLFAGFIAFLAAAALSQFGVDLHSSRAPEREVHRVADCRQAPATTITLATPPSDC